MERSERSAGGLSPNNEANHRPHRQHDPASSSPGAMQGDIRARPKKGNHQQNKKTLVKFPYAGDDDLQQQYPAQERNVAEILQMGINQVESQAQAQRNPSPLQRFQGIHQAPAPAEIAA